MSITGEPGGPPVKTGNPVADINAGILAVAGIVAAYAHKLKTGQGQIVDTSLMEAALQQTYWHAAIYFATGRVAGPDRLGAPADRAVPGVSRERRLDQHRRREPGELGAHRRRARPSRVARRSALRDQLGAHGRTSTRSRRAMNAVLATRTHGRVDRRVRRGRRAGRARSTRSARRSRIRRRSRAAWSSISCIRRPGRPRRSAARSISRRRRRASTRPAPLLGEHTREVLREYGYVDAEIDAFVAAGVVQDAANQ